MGKVTDIKEIVAANLVKYRKEAKMTQSQVAEKLNYSDKAISKWERGESLPDVYVLKQISDIYGVEIDDMLHEQTTREKIHSFYRNRAVVSALSVLLVWLVAMIVYVVIEIVIPNTVDSSLAFIYAVPVSFIVALVFNNMWGARIYNMIIVSGINWGISFSVVLTLDDIVSTIWYLYFISAVFEILTILWYLLDVRKVRPAKKKAVQEPDSETDQAK